MTPPRRTRGWLDQLAQELSRRDWAVLEDLGRVRLLTGRQVQRLHVTNGSALTQARRARSVMERLNDLELVSRLERRVGGMRSGSAGFTYALSAVGQRLITGRGPAGGVRLRRYWEPSRPFVDHLLGVSELYVKLRELEGTDEQIELLDFEAEPVAWRSWWGAGGERRTIRPDAFVAVGDGRDEVVSFVELDLATESQRIIAKKAEQYLTYWHSGEEQRRLGVFPKVVFVVPDEHRAAAITGTLSKLEPESWQLFQVVRQEVAAEALAGRPPPGQTGSHRSTTSAA